MFATNFPPRWRSRLVGGAGRDTGSGQGQGRACRACLILHAKCAADGACAGALWARRAPARAPSRAAHPRRQRAGRSLKTGARRAGSAGRAMLGARRSTPQHEAYGGGRDASPPVDNAYGRWGGLWSTKRGGPAGRPGEPRMWPFSSWPRGSWAHQAWRGSRRRGSRRRASGAHEPKTKTRLHKIFAQREGV